MTLARTSHCPLCGHATPEHYRHCPNTIAQKEAVTTPTCSICNTPYEGHGHNPRPLLGPAARCCSACNDTVVIPLRMARLVAYEGAQRVAEFALMLARMRAKLPPPRSAS